MGGVTGLVSADALFSGFASPTVITVIEILLIVQVLKRSALIALATERMSAFAGNERHLTLGLCAMGAALSVVMNNIGALALMLPLAISVCERNGVPVDRVLMPLSFATLMGGLCSVVGTPANLLGAAAIEQVRGAPFGFFELALVGLPITLAGLVYLGLTIPSRPTPGRAGHDRTRAGRRLVGEASVPPNSPAIGLPVEALLALHHITIHNIVRADKFVFGRGERVIQAGDTLVLEAQSAVLEDALSQGLLARGHPGAETGSRREAVILPDSLYVGSTIADLVAFEALDIAVIAASVSTRRVEGRFADLRLSVGDILVLEGDPRAIAAECDESGLLEIAPAPPVAAQRPDVFPAVVFGIGIAAAALLGTAPEIAFGLVIVVLALSGHLSLRQGFEDIDWPILLLLGSMIPLGNAIAETGAANAVAQLVAQALPQANALSLAAAMLVMAVLLTPFVNNPTTVLVLAPVGIAFADTYGVEATPALIAITVGASIDFLTPFGHHNNTLVMGIAGYRFTEFFRRGWPLTLLAGAVTLAALALFYT